VNRVIVVGAPGCGKTTTARAMSAALGLPHTELDSLWWEPNWVEAGEELFSARARLVVEKPRWVLDGNYFSVGAQNVIWPAADTVVWLDLPRHIAVPRVLRRSIVRGVRRNELWNGNRESLLNVLRPDSIVKFAWTAWPKYGQRYREIMATGEFAHIDWVHLRAPAEVRAWVTSLSA
jgi:adenylate kinase family enzyme